MRPTLPVVSNTNEVTEYDVLKKDTIQGYTILNEVGKGASGVVYAARQVEGGRLVAIKVFYSHYSRNKEFIARLIREAETLKKIHHENIVQGYGHGFSHGYYYTVMEFIEGNNLESRLRQDGPFDEDEGMKVAFAVGRALEEANRYKIIHRDIKPANIVVTPSGEIKLMDFGLAKEEIDTTMTMSGTILGTPCYISPEQARGLGNLDIRSDLYSLGVTLYHLLVGEIPFIDLPTQLLLTKKITDDIPSPKLKNPDLSDACCYVIARLCDRDRKERYQSPTELCEDLNLYHAGKLKPNMEIRVAPSKAADTEKLFSKLKLTDELLRDLLKRKELPVSKVYLKENEVIFYEEDTSKETYLLLKGKLEVIKAGRPIAIIREPGVFVGEMSILLDAPRTATVRTLEESYLLRIPGDKFHEFIRLVPEFSFRLAVSLAERLDKTTEQLKEEQGRLGSIREHISLVREELQL